MIFTVQIEQKVNIVWNIDSICDDFYPIWNRDFRQS